MSVVVMGVCGGGGGHLLDFYIYPTTAMNFLSDFISMHKVEKFSNKKVPQIANPQVADLKKIVKFSRPFVSVEICRSGFAICGPRLYIFAIKVCYLRIGKPKKLADMRFADWHI
jgi:hypothetical protein